ncbi:MAG: hypothetical protein CVU79_11695, partial [Elusimicrobia bacterium HGW-Elusimicrobia-3]
GTQNALAHTVRSLINRARRYASLALMKVLLTLPLRSPLREIFMNDDGPLCNQRSGGDHMGRVSKSPPEGEACVSAEPEGGRRGHGVADADFAFLPIW